MDTQENVEELSAAGWTENLFSGPHIKKNQKLPSSDEVFFVKLKNMTHFVQFSEL